MHCLRPRRRCARAIVACAALLSAPCAPLAGDKPQAYEIDAGFDTAPQSLYWYKEAIVAMNHDLAKSGILVRLYGSVAVYSYAGPTGATIDGTLWQVDAMPGYQYVRGAETFSLPRRSVFFSRTRSARLSISFRMSEAVR